MPSVFRERNGAGFWQTGVTIPFKREERKKYQASKVTPAKRVVGSCASTAGHPSVTKGASPHRQAILDLLREYYLTGLTVEDVADELGLHSGHVHKLMGTLVSMHLVRSVGKVLSQRKMVHQYKLLEKR